MSTNLIGQVLLNQFRVDAFIASGGMGAVYRVWDLKRNVPLAMKVLHSDLAEDPSVFKRFKREANALKKLAHPNIVPFYGLYQTKDFAFLLERYVDGPSLKEIIREHLGKPIPINEVLIYTKALSAALGYAHANGVVHCDVKPGNVMVDRGGNIYLTDFGIARHAESTVTTLATAGTGAYMAPEQIRGEPVSPATDVYALGALLFEMLTGRKLFTGDEKDSESSGSTVGERIRFGHLQLPPPDPRSYNPALPEALAQVITKALKKQPNQRYPSVHELYEELCNSISVSSGSIPDRAKIQEDSWENDQGFTEKGEMKKHRRLPWVITIIGLFIIGILALVYIIIRDKYPIHIGKESENQTTELAVIDSSSPSATIAMKKTILPTATFLLSRTPTPLMPTRTSTTPIPRFTMPTFQTSTPISASYTFKAAENLMCRRGPETYYEHAYDILKGETYNVMARWRNDWLLLMILNPRVETRTRCCWVGGNGTLNVDIGNIRLIDYWVEDMRITCDIH
jgi:serine/threonine protein kinase